MLPGRHRETQTGAFGKRGKSLHGAVAIRWDASTDDFQVLSVRVACDDADQTWFHTLSALRVTLDVVRSRWSDTDELTVQSDGANNYSCTGFMTSVQRTCEAAGFRLRRHAVTEVRSS